MLYKFDYTTRARRMALNHPLLSDIGIQIIFWIIAFLIYFILVNYISKAVTSLFDLNAIVHMTENVLIALFGSIVFGTLLGLIDYYIEKRFRTRSFGLEILLKFVCYVIIWFSVGSLLRVIGFAVDAQFIEGIHLEYGQIFFTNMGHASSVYTVFMILVISFIKQMNNKFGPGIILPMILGKYRKPREEERIFMFMDLKSSTKYAEMLGHLKYSEMIQSCFMDINKVIPTYYAEVYQYVGDEVVLTWPKDEGLKNLNSIHFFFAYQKLLQNKKEDYNGKFGLLPEFKASLHLGKITVAEVGDIKREIAYHGDTINIGARIQSLCNKYDQNFLISETVKDNISLDNRFRIDFIDETVLKGKTKTIKLYSVEKNN